MTKLSFDKNKLKFLLLENIHQNAIDAMVRGGYSNIETHKKSLEGQALLDALADVHFLGIRSRTNVTEEVLAAAPKLTAIGCFCIGTNQVDLVAAAKRGIPVFNAPFSNTRSVAELVIAETVMLMRGITEKNAIVHRGGWVKSAEGSFEVRGKTLGIIGYGHIGTQVGILAEHMGMRVVFYDIEGKLPLGNARQLPTLEALLAESDVVTLHVPETPQTANMIRAAQLAQMKPGAHLINAARGTVVDIDALAAAMKSGHIGGCAIDVFPVEPKGNDEEFLSPLRQFDNALLTPHIGGSTIEAQANIGIEVADKLVRYSDNGSTITAVNFPEVSLPAHPGKCRLLHIHKNVPGILAQINERFGKRGINISSQFLQTNEHIGYCVMDVDTAASELALEEIQSVTGTIRARVLY
ncbi:MAG: phosphoglycerate dehydrogenase [Burkholderiales bacterium]|jgi:D-3-phosphoglycerate dehydrogenase|nr:phosphoglycerate dehydrogenase [Burkholderiales bacterium]MCA3161867.1 phosphoglycerate dehydrogenase [Burkholderiales bacterium]MCA3163299.1 phosphoglycerate dehydrogenase [Burkholderiales bacterium]MCA3166691.1 phosphoglycerate dehydrogenase [Burkholderiales bacterium]MCA3170199.1 phosphoglycerate dehydrogenase [Burkholderiales bacterium]